MALELLAGAAVVLLVTVAVRAGYRILGDRRIWSKPFPLAGNAGDGMTHLLLTDLIRRNQGRIPRTAETFLLEECSDYPMLFHKLHAVVPRALLDRIEWIVSPFWEAVHMGGVFLGCYVLLSRVFGIPSAAGVACLIALGVSCTPLLVKEVSRATVYGPRAFGFLFGNTFLFCSVAFAGTGNVWWLAGAVGAYAVTAVSSKFAVQAATFITLTLSLIRLDPTPALVWGGCFLASVPLSGGYMLWVLGGSVRHSIIYKQWLSKIHIYTTSFSLGNFRAAAALALRGRLRSAWAEAARHPATTVLLDVPWVVLLAVLLAQGGFPSAEAGAGRDLLGWFESWVFAGMIVCALTFLDSLKFLGEAERYLEYILVPLVTVVTLGAMSRGGWALWLWGGVMALCVLKQLRDTVAGSRLAPLTEDRPAMQLMEYLRTLHSSVLIAIPGRLCYPMAYETGHRFFWVMTNFPRGPRLSRLKELLGSNGRAAYPFLSPDVIPRLGPSFGVDYVVVSKNHLALAARQYGIVYDFAPAPVLFENDGYAVYPSLRG